ncbi:protein kinase family protein [Lactobacillaceae bacterium Melli_B3]
MTKCKKELMSQIPENSSGIVNFLKENFNFPLKKYDIFEYLSSGTNAKTFKIRHILLDQIQILKVYVVDDYINTMESRIQEIKKNSKYHNFNNRTRIFDAEKDKSKKEFIYSIMENYDGQTLNNWINCANNKIQELLEDDKKIDIKETLIYRVLNLSINFLNKTIQKDKEEIVHGDLNLDNILIPINYGTYGDLNVDINKSLESINYVNKGKLGKLESIPMELIDMGQSTYNNIDKGSLKPLRIRRESTLIYDDFIKIIGIIFENGEETPKKWFNLYKNYNSLYFKDSKDDTNFIELTSEIIKMVLILNLIFGLNSQTSEVTELDSCDINTLNNYLTGNKLNNSDYQGIIDYPIVDNINYEFDLANKIKENPYPNNSYKYVNWDNLLLY